MVLGFLCLSSLRVQAQEVVFEIPTTYNLVEGKLAVTFVGAVTEAQARALMDVHGYAVAEGSFEALVVRAETPSPLSEAQLAALRTRPGLLSVEQAPVNDVRTLSNGVVEAGGKAIHKVMFSFAGEMQEADARAVAATVPGLQVKQVTAPPKELVIEVTPGEEEVAIEVLEKSPLVRYVSYINSEE